MGPPTDVPPGVVTDRGVIVPDIFSGMFTVAVVGFVTEAAIGASVPNFTVVFPSKKFVPVIVTVPDSGPKRLFTDGFWVASPEASRISQLVPSLTIWQLAPLASGAVATTAVLFGAISAAPLTVNSDNEVFLIDSATPTSAGLVPTAGSVSVAVAMPAYT